MLGPLERPLYRQQADQTCDAHNFHARKKCYLKY